jgi:hypothetical protein
MIAEHVYSKFEVFRQFRPLALGIHESLIAALPQFDATLISRVVANHCRKPRYVKSLARGGKRFDLAGKPSGEVSAEEKKAAQLMSRPSLQRRLRLWKLYRTIRLLLNKLYSPVSDPSLPWQRGVLHLCWLFLSWGCAMRWVFAPDSFKGSLDAADVANAMRQELNGQILMPSVLCAPWRMEGRHAGCPACGSRRAVACYPVCNASGVEQPVACLLLPDGTAVVEVARIIGLPDAGNTLVTQRSSRGVGQLLLALLADGYRRIAVALGGSSTNDGGAGCLVALGLQLHNAQGERLQGSLQDVLDFDAVL